MIPQELKDTSTRKRTAWPDPRFTIVGSPLFRDDFTGKTLPDWIVETEAGGTVQTHEGHLVIDVPAGCTVWFRPELTGPVLIEYEAAVVQKGGPNDRLSDLNCFWMAQDPARPDNLLRTKRSGKFSDYDSLITYYVGQGGNRNTTTRFRRYIGKTGDRPLLPEHDLRTPEFLLRPNVRQKIRLVACKERIQYWRDDRLIFDVEDPTPYTRGWFGLRTTASHLQIAHFRVYRLIQNGKLTDS